MLSGVIMAWSRSEKLIKMTLECIESYRDQLDELIVVEDGGEFVKEYMDKADKYVFNRDNGGFTRSVNQGFKLFSGTHLAVISNDTFLTEGNIRNLVIKDTVTSPKIVNQDVAREYTQGFASPFFVMPRTVLDQIGTMDERMRVYYSDTLLVEKMKKIGIKIAEVPEVKIFHHVKQSVVDEQAQYAHDEPYYKELHDSLDK